MKTMIDQYSFETINWMLMHRMVFPVISLCQMLCNMEPEYTKKIIRWQTLLNTIHEWAPPVALGNVYLELAATCADSDKRDRQRNAQQYCVLALSCFQGSADISYHLRSSAIIVEVSFGQDYEIRDDPRPLHHIAQRKIFHEYVCQGHFASAQGVMLKAAHIAAMASQYEFFWIFSAFLDELDESLGGTRMRILGKLHQIMTMVGQGGQVSKVLESLSGIFSHVVTLNIPYISGMHAAACATAYLSLGRTNIAQFWARECWAWWRKCTEDQTAQGASYYLPFLIQGLERDVKLGNSTSTAVSTIQARILSWIAKDTANDRWNYTVESWCLMASIEGDVRKNIPNALQQLQSALHSIPKDKIASDAIKSKSKIIKLRAGYILSDPTSTRHDKLQAISELKQLLASNMNVLSTDMAMSFLQLGKMLLSHFGSLAETPGDLTYLQQAVHYMRVAWLMFERSNRPSQCLESSFRYAIGLYIIWQASKTAENSQKAFQAVKIAEIWLDRRRRELSSMSGIFAILEKQNLARDGRAASLSNMHFELAIALGQGLEPWLAIVNAKARSISDMLSMGLKIPETLMLSLETLHRESFAFLQTHLQLMKQIAGEASPEKRLLLRAVNEDYFLRQLEKRPELDDIQAAITARAIGEKDLMNLWKLLISIGMGSDFNVRIIDWFVRNGRLTICAMSGKEPTKLWTTNITEQQVKNWQAEFLETKAGLKKCLDADTDDPEAPFRQLEGLVAPLADYVNEDDLLILFPCRILHAIPLHVLHIRPPGNDWPIPLIERCKVVYSASFSVFAQCLNRSMVGFPSSDRYEPDVSYRTSKCTFVGVYQDERDIDGKEEEAIAEQLVGLAASENDATCLVGFDATAKAFEERGAGAKLIHFHGHCNFDATNVLDQALIFSQESGQETSSTQSIPPLPTRESRSLQTEDLDHEQAVEQILQELEQVRIDTENGKPAESSSAYAQFPQSQSQPASKATETTHPTNTETLIHQIASEADDEDDPEPSRYYPFYDTHHLNKWSLGSLAMKFSPSESESKAIRSELELGSSTRPNELSICRTFDLKLSAQHGPIVMLIACESAKQRVGPSDEPLGLATGFLCAGASTVLGTLWRTESEYARVFSEVFYELLGEQRRNNILDKVDGVAGIGRDEHGVRLTISIIDLSDLFQKTVCQLMNDDKTRNYRYWAPFTLMGSPFSMWADEAHEET